MDILKKIFLETEYIFHKETRASKILYYHDINDSKLHEAYTSMSTPADLFKSHLDLIKNNGFEIVSKITKPEGQVMIGLDDGWAGVYDIKDFLVNNNIFPTISIAPGLLNLAGYLSSGQVKVLHSLGFGIACHSWTHQSITLYNNNKLALKREFLDSKNYLEDLLSDKISIFCYPKGIFSKDTYEKALEYGYAELWSVVDGDYFDEVFPKVKKRCLVQFRSAHEVKLILKGTNRILGERHYKLSYKL